MASKISGLDALAVNLWILCITGAWIADIKKPTYRFLYNLYAIGIMSLMTLAYFLSEIFFLFMIWGDLEAISEISFLLLTHVGNGVKLLNILIRRKRIENLVLDLCQRIFLPKNVKHQVLLRSMISSANRDNIIFILMCSSTIMAWAIIPLIEKSEVRRLPLKMWLPFPINSSPIFELVYIYQILAVTFNAWMNAMMDTFASVLMAFTGAQLDMLRNDLLDLKDGVDDEESEKIAVSQNVYGISKISKVVHDEAKHKLQTGVITREFHSCRENDILHERIISCIEHHRTIVRFASEIQDIFGIGIFFQFAVSSTILCLTCFELTLISPASLQFYSLLLYQCCMLFQIYCYCWHGNGIISKTSELMTAAFQCQWTSCSPKFKTTLRIMMCRMQQPMQLTVGGLFGLSLETFSMILRSAYSFYAVIQRVHGTVNTEETQA